MSKFSFCTNLHFAHHTVTMGRVYVTFREETFVVSWDDNSGLIVSSLLREVSRRFSVAVDELRCFLLDEDGAKRGLALDPATSVVADKSCFVVEKVAVFEGDSAASALKDRGNALLAASKFAEATATYSQAIAIPGLSPALRNALFLNRSLANLKQSLWKAAENDARAVLAIDPDSVKARYRLGQALFGSGQIATAHKVLSEALDLVGGCVLVTFFFFFFFFFLKAFVQKGFAATRSSRRHRKID